MGHSHTTGASNLIYAATTVWLSFMAKDHEPVTDDEKQFEPNNKHLSRKEI
jgi:hypothetical protein